MSRKASTFHTSIAYLFIFAERKLWLAGTPVICSNSLIFVQAEATKKAAPTKAAAPVKQAGIMSFFAKK
jgi:hypothetical protein